MTTKIWLRQQQAEELREDEVFKRENLYKS
jgi:hypothetical protein